jgi:hypothetical protein
MTTECYPKPWHLPECQIPKTLPLMQLFMPPSEIRADSCHHNFQLTSRSLPTSPKYTVGK